MTVQVCEPALLTEFQYEKELVNFIMIEGTGSAAILYRDSEGTELIEFKQVLSGKCYAKHTK